MGQKGNYLEGLQCQVEHAMFYAWNSLRCTFYILSLRSQGITEEQRPKLIHIGNVDREFYCLGSPGMRYIPNLHDYLSTKLQLGFFLLRWHRTLPVLG